jgi:hypothetical protein
MEKSSSSTTSVVYKVDQKEVEKEKPKPNISFKEMKLKAKPNKSVTWTEDTVNNEFMNKKKSKSKNLF